MTIHIGRDEMGSIFKSKFLRTVMTSIGTALGIWIGGQIAKAIENGIEKIVNGNHSRHGEDKQNND